MPTLGRDVLAARLESDLAGPGADGETLSDRPSDVYLTGILFPRGSKVSAAEDEQPEEGEPDVGDAGGGTEAVSLATALRPSSAGISFAVSAPQRQEPCVRVRVSCGIYRRTWLGEGGTESTEHGKRKDERWTRTQHDIHLPPVTLAESMPDNPLQLEPFGLQGMSVYFRALLHGSTWTVTVALVNEFPEADNRAENEERSFFQTELLVEAVEGSRLVPRPSRRPSVDDDGRAAALIYRDAVEYASGHTCSAAADVREGAVATVRSTWMPRTVVPATNPRGDAVFDVLAEDSCVRPLSAAWISESSDADLHQGLTRLVAAYARWLDTEERRILSLPPELRPQAKQHVATCRQGQERMAASVELVRADVAVRQAFRLANRAMLVQRSWQYGAADLTWRPFQLAFQLLSLASLADPKHPDRSVMDLLWFPTGGGKTEAYLALTAFVLFHRRLSRGPVAGAGVAVLMRYTLRLLTTQQFERAATLICACETLRRGQGLPPGQVAGQLGHTPFSIGLWVGSGATPNKVSEAKNLNGGGQETPKQLVACPVCRRPLGPCIRTYKPDAIRTKCENPTCDFVKAGGDFLPVWTVDEDIYRERPSVVIGTIDKFALITRRPDRTGVLFGLGTQHDPPDLIIQDELHLISGPLGTIAALYEIAVDELCSRDGARPKIIGSTATIRRASEQIRALFDRATYQFPAPCIDWHNSCFAVRDPKAAGRLYVGLTTAGRSPKFVLQATYASLLQGATDAAVGSNDDRDPYWTLVGYFNSLRELSGALTLVQDDVGRSIDEFSARRKETPRQVGPAVELNSRKSSAEIPVILSDLKRKVGDPGAYDVLLASNMISVGVDIPRLGLMVVNGQPKQVAEYIQATSRVGRERPGLVVSVFNNGKTRDRSHFETFDSWHSTLYREVEATSVTPFASRALDKAMHAVLVALVRQRVDGMGTQPLLASTNRAACEVVAARIAERAKRVDSDELPGVTKKLQALLDEWSGRTDLEAYWDDFRDLATLLVSAEQAAALKAAKKPMRRAWPTPNSMRDVEPATPFVLVNRLRNVEADDAAK